MAKIIAIANHKGGVGKTTSVANIGAALAIKGRKVLLIDLDSQQNLTFHFLKNEADEIELSIFDALLGKVQLPILYVKQNLYLVPASIDLARAEIDLNSQLSKEFLLRGLLEDVADSYDYILLDCPPSLGIITSNALTAATDLYIPLTAEALPLKGLTMLEEIVALIRKRVNHSLTISGVFFTRFNRNRKISSVVVDNIEQRYGDRVFTTKIRENVALVESPLAGQDIFDYAPNSNGAKDYMELAGEILSRYNDTNIRTK